MNRIVVYDSPQNVAAAAAEQIVTAAGNAIQAKGRFSWCLSGGSTPRMPYELLASPAYRQRIDWAHCDIFWGDERCVPPEHAESDYNMARNALLDQLPHGSSPRIYRLLGELDPRQAAQSYEALLHGYFGENPSQSFDLLLLGMGEDGHTASLFPGTAPIHEATRWVRAHHVAKLGAWRLTLTPPILNLAVQVIFLVTGDNKRETLHAVLNGPRQPNRYPSQVIQPRSQSLTWLVDRAAAGE
jgi:6-phosphogluconolactonase